MKYIKIAIVLWSTSWLLCSCDNRKDPYLDLDQNPVLTVMRPSESTGSVLLIDSVKLGLTYTFKYSLESFEKLNVTLTQSKITDSIGLVDNIVNVKSLSEGVSTVGLSVLDPFGKGATAKVELTVFRNLSPICKMTVTKVAQLSPYEIQIDASASYDQDSKWGGKIVNYEYQVQNDYDKITPLSSIRYICDSPGQKMISVRVQDNDGAWSDQVITYFMLE
jgi:hypothetical protein